MHKFCCLLHAINFYSELDAGVRCMFLSMNCFYTELHGRCYFRCILLEPKKPYSAHKWKNRKCGTQTEEAGIWQSSSYTRQNFLSIFGVEYELGKLCQIQKHQYIVAIHSYVIILLYFISLSLCLPVLSICSLAFVSHLLRIDEIRTNKVVPSDISNSVFAVLFTHTHSV